MKPITPIRRPWAGTMTARERFTRQLRGQSVDRCCNMEFGYRKESFKTWPLFYENGVTDLKMSDLEIIIHFSVLSLQYSFRKSCRE